MDIQHFRADLLTNKKIEAVPIDWNHPHHKLYSLIDMIVILADEGFETLNELVAEGFRLSEKATLSAEDMDAISHTLERIARFCEKMQLEIGIARLEPFVEILKRGNVSGAIVRHEYECLWENMTKELRLRKLAVIPPGKVNFIEQDALFGWAVNQAFPSAKQEIRDSGNCLAVDLNTAAVFHLMRAAEIGLRALAKHLRVKKIKKHVPLEFATWDEIIKALDKKTEALMKMARGPKRHEALNFYNGALMELRAVKDLWRNPVMHKRSDCTEIDALQAFDHVRRFMQILSEKVKEI